MQNIKPFIWYNSDAEAAAEYYISIFKDGKIISRMKGGDGKVMGVTFELLGMQYIAFNGGSTFQLNEAFSMFITCDTQEEIDLYWDKLSEGGKKSRCGWLKDKFGLWWQVVPAVLGGMLTDANKSGKVMQAVMQMDKLIIADLEKAYDS